MSETIETTHLRRLTRLRFAVVGGQLIAVLTARFGLDTSLPLVPMLALILGLLTLSLITQRRLAMGGPVAPLELALHLLADIVQLTLLLYLSGGYANPFMFMLLPPLAIAAAALSIWYSGWIAATAVLCYTILLFAYVPLPALDRLAFVTPTVLRQTGMWICFVVSAAMIVFFVIRTRQTLREKDRELAEARERALDNEHLALMGSLAAGTAHELGTPLATMSFIAEELEAELDNADQRSQVTMLRQQIDRCRAAIGQLANKAEALPATAGRAGAVDRWLREAVERWRAQHPETDLVLELDGPYPSPRLLLDRALEQALSTLVSNAIRASRAVTIAAHWDSDLLSVDVLDRGPGVPRHLSPLLGREPLGRRPDVAGSGLGLYLATSTLERLGGNLTLTARPGGGTRAQLVLPLATLSIDDPTEETNHVIAPVG